MPVAEAQPIYNSSKCVSMVCNHCWKAFAETSVILSDWLLQNRIQFYFAPCWCLDWSFFNSSALSRISFVFAQEDLSSVWHDLRIMGSPGNHSLWPKHSCGFLMGVRVWAELRCNSRSWFEVCESAITSMPANSVWTCQACKGCFVPSLQFWFSRQAISLLVKIQFAKTQNLYDKGILN